MNNNININTISIFYSSLEHIPPPFNFKFKIDINFDTKKFNFALEYLHLQELSEDDFEEPDFIMPTNEYLEGILPENWIQRLQNITFLKSKVTKIENKLEVILPQESLIYNDYTIAQELIQAIYELNELEHKLKIEFIFPKEPENSVLISVSFLKMEFILQRNINQISIKPWEDCFKFLNLFYNSDLDEFTVKNQSKNSNTALIINIGDTESFHLNEKIYKDKTFRDLLNYLNDK